MNVSDDTPYLPLNICPDDSAEEPREAEGDESSKEDYRLLQAGVWIKALATLCVLVFVLKEDSSKTEETRPQQNMISASFLATNKESELDISIIGDPIPVWRSVDTLHKCKMVDVPDIPTRAYVDTSNTIHMIQGSTSFHRMTGPSLFNVTRDCEASYNKTANPDPSQFAGNEFLDSPIAFDNGTVVSLAHTEYPGDNYDNCKGPHYPYCWTVTMGLMVSHDFGKNWQHARPPPHHLVAAVPYGYNETQLASGWGDPTNILKHPTDGYYYVAAWNRNQVGVQAAGVCMMRTNSLLDPSSWRAWNGSHYSVSFASPYTNDAAFDPSHHICTVLNVDTTHLEPTHCNPFGLVYSKPLGRFLMTWNCLNGHGSIYLTTSNDLIHWSTPQPFYDKTLLPDATKHNVTSLHYPNLMDASAPTAFGDRNYGIIGDTPHLFWVSIGHSPYSDGRSAWATPLRIQPKVALADESSSL